MRCYPEWYCVIIMHILPHPSPLASWYKFILLGEQGRNSVSSLGTWIGATPTPKPSLQTHYYSIVPALLLPTGRTDLLESDLGGGEWTGRTERDGLTGERAGWLGLVVEPPGFALLEPPWFEEGQNLAVHCWADGVRLWFQLSQLCSNKFHLNSRIHLKTVEIRGYQTEYFILRNLPREFMNN